MDNSKKCYLIDDDPHDQEILLKGIPVIICSTSGELEDITKSPQLGASGFFKKSIDYSSRCNMLSVFFCDGLRPGELKKEEKGHPE